MLKPTKSLAVVEPQLLVDHMLIKYGSMSHLKIQKLLYYIQAYHLAYFDEPIIDCDFEAWVHGPVCRKVFDDLRDKSLLYTDISYTGALGEGNPSEALTKTVTSDQINLIEEVLTTFADWKGTELEALSHSETPWIEARGGKDPSEKCNTVIRRESMRIYYKQFLT